VSICGLRRVQPPRAPGIPQLGPAGVSPLSDRRVLLDPAHFDDSDTARGHLILRIVIIIYLITTSVMSLSDSGQNFIGEQHRVGAAQQSGLSQQGTLRASVSFGQVLQYEVQSVLSPVFAQLSHSPDDLSRQTHRLGMSLC
jgi:hypothetical protein